MTIETEELEKVWLAHHRQPLSAAFYDDNAALSFMATTAGANGSANIARFLAQNSGCAQLFGSGGADNAGSADDGASHLVSRTFAPMAGGDVHVTEEWAVRMEHGEDMQWLLPAVSPTRKQVVFAMVVVGVLSAVSKRIEQKKVYWDQATVLRQIGLLPSDVSRLPSSAARPVHAKIMPIATGYDQIARQLDQFNAETGNKLFQQAESSVDWSRPGTANSAAAPTYKSQQSVESVQAAPKQFNRRQYAGGRDSISFGDDQAPMFPKQVAQAPRQYSVSSVASDADSHKEMLANAAKNDSHFSWEHDGTPHLEHLTIHKRPGPNPPGEDHWSVPGDATQLQQKQQPYEQLQPQQPRDGPPPLNTHGKKYHNQSHFSFGGGEQESPVNVWQSSSNGGGTVQSRPSSRVLSTPGGRSNFTFA